MASKNSVMVFIEQDEGKMVDVSLELVCKGRELADRLGVTLSAVLCGQNVGDMARQKSARWSYRSPLEAP